MGLLDRLSVHLLSRWPAWLGRVHLDTSVAFSGEHDVVHTTVVRWFGLPLQKSVEVFTLDPDGQHFTVQGGMTGSGSVDAAGMRAEYTLRWLGMEMRQHTVLQDGRVLVEQDGPGFHGHQELVRVTR